MKKLILFVSLFCFGCATTHPGVQGHSLTPEGQSLTVSASTDGGYSDESNIYLDFTLENRSSRWIKAEQVSIEFPNSENVPHNVIVGDDLKAWAESYANKKKRDDHNANIGAAGLVLAGMTIALLALNSGNRGMASMGLATTAAGETWKAYRDVKDARLAAIRSVSVPENYLIAPVTIPSGGLIRRWLLVNIPQKLISKKAVLTMQTIEGETLRYEVPIQL